MPAVLRAALILSVTLLAACGEPEDTRPGQPVKQRQQAFKDIINSFEPMGVMLRKGSYDAERFGKFTAELVAKRDLPWSHFGPDTNYPPTKATPEVWNQPETFEKEKQGFIAATDKLQTAVQGGDKTGIEKAYDAVHDSCKSCHKQFKVR
ncbi:MAG: cytochrome c [Dechloromonas sp.]|nr:cytochrome c [Dechloromonas sp.]